MASIDKELIAKVTEFAKTTCNTDSEDHEIVKHCKDSFLKELYQYNILSLRALEALAKSRKEWDKLIAQLSAILSVCLNEWKKDRIQSLKRKADSQHQHPSEQRRIRWAKLNRELVKKDSDKTKVFSDLRWSLVPAVYGELTDYMQEEVAIGDDQIEDLRKFYDRALTCMNDVGDSELRINVLIAPIFIQVCSLISGIKIFTEEVLNGIQVQSNGKFEFVIKKGNTRIFVIEAKKDDIDQGIAQDLVGCEVAADIGNLNVVYGIVTTFKEWIFLKNSNDKVEKNQVILSITQDKKVSPESLKTITGKIHAILLSDEN